MVTKLPRADVFPGRTAYEVNNGHFPLIHNLFEVQPVSDAPKVRFR